MKGKRILALALGVALALAFALSLAYILVEAHHDCVGAGCQVCRNIQFCVRLITEKLALIAAAPFLFLSVSENSSVRALAAKLLRAPTPVSLKVKLSN